MKDSIIADLKNSYGITFDQITSVTGGFLNRKWKISTDRGELLVKQYSAKRFRIEQIEKIESALQRQVILEKNGVPCPFLWQCKGRVIRWPDDETAYMVMDFRPGKIESPDTITAVQMRSLGNACATMHTTFSLLPAHTVKGLPVYGGYTMGLLREYLNACKAECAPDARDEYRNALLAIEPIAKRLDTDFFDKFPKGFAHEDFQPGNILFHPDGVSTIIDFDRNCYSYIWHDIGRAILSFALEGSTMNAEKVCAFLEGYSQHAALSLSNIVEALRLTWCIEIPWWIQPEFFKECDEIPTRFKHEILWLTKHWFELDSIVHSK